MSEMAEQRLRRASLAERYGTPEHITALQALDLARITHADISPYVTAGEVWASIYVDDAAADAWLEANLVHHGHPTLARVRLEGGRVLGILDLRPAMKGLAT